MAIGIDDLDEYVDYNPDLIVQNVNQEPPQNNFEQGDDDYISDFLKTRGISDMSKIMFEDDNNQIIERNWKDLSKVEKINILNTPLEQPSQDNNDLSEEEINLLNTIRKNNMTPNQFIESIKGETVVQEPVYKIDDLSDDEIFLLDLESRVGELSDEEGAQVLANAKQNEDFYKKQVEGIRKEYKEREDFKVQQDQAKIEQEQLEAFQQYQDQVINSINNFKAIGNLDLNLEDDDKEELAEFMLSQDETGQNYLYQALQDPETLTKIAWFILNGEEAFNSVSDYFTNQIKQVSEAQYKKGFEDGKKGVSTRPQVVTTKNNNKVNRQIKQTYSSIDDLE